MDTSLIIIILCCFCCLVLLCGSSYYVYEKGSQCLVDPIACIIGGFDLGIPANCPTGYEKSSDADLFCYKPCPIDWKGTSTITHCQHKTIYSTVGADTTKSIPTGCGDGKTKNAGLCYDVPDGWHVTSPGFIGKKCPGTVDGKKVNDSGTTCWYDRGAGAVPSLTCPIDQVQKGVECYEKPPDGYDWTTLGGLLIGKICPAGSNDSLTTCWYDRGAGRIPDKQPCSYWNNSWRDDGTSCWNDAHIFGRLRAAGWNGNCNSDEDKRCEGVCGASLVSCYKRCPAGYNNDGQTCRKVDVGIKKTLFDRQKCNADEELIAGLCYKKPKPGFTCTATNCSFSKDVKSGTKKGTTKQSCPDGKSIEAGLCYTPAKSGYTCTATICDYSKGVKSQIGKLPDKCPDNRQLVGRLCYPACDTGYERRGDNLEYCSTKCPTGFTNIGIGGCEKPKLELIKNGVCPDGYKKNGARCYLNE